MTNLDSVLKAKTSLCQQRSVQSKLWFFQYSIIDVRAEPLRRLSAEELMFWNCGADARTDAKAEATILGPPDAKSQLIGKDPNAGKD